MKGLMNVDILKKLPETDIILRPIAESNYVPVDDFKGMKILDIMILSGILLNFIFEIILMVIYSR